MDVYNSLLGHEGKRVEPLVQSAEVIYEYLFGEKIKPEAPDRASIWTDTNVYNEFGLPAIKIGAPRAAHRTRDTGAAVPARRRADRIDESRDRPDEILDCGADVARVKSEPVPFFSVLYRYMDRTPAVDRAKALRTVRPKKCR